MNFEFEFYTSYNQFYICDKNHKGDTSSINFWNNEAIEDRLAIGSQILGVRTASYGNIRGIVNILEFKQEIESLELYDHIVETGLYIESGTIQILDCPNSEVELQINLIPGNYTIRIYSSNLGIEDEESEHPEDYYRIDVWKSSNIYKNVIKRFTR